MRQFHGAASTPAYRLPLGRLFVFGLGYSATLLARRLKAQGWTVGGTSQSEEKCTAFAAEKINAVRFDGSQPIDGVGTLLERTTHLLISVPPDRDGDPVLRHHAGDIAALK